MATVEKRGESYRIIFYFWHKRVTTCLKQANAQKAEEQTPRLQGSLDLLEQGRLEYEPGKDDLRTLLLTDGRLNARPEPVKRMTLGEFVKEYQANRPLGKERTT